MYARLWGAPGLEPGGAGRPSLVAARASAGAWIVTTGSPKVNPRRLLTDPPKEWPASHTLEWGYRAVTLPYRSIAAR